MSQIADSTSSYDIIIIGSGFAGAALAYFCAKQGASVLVLEANEYCGGSSGACAGRVQLIDSHSGEYLDLVLAGHQRLQTLGDELDTDLEWETPGHLTLIGDEPTWMAEENKVTSIAERGFAAEMVDHRILQKLEPYLDGSQFIGASRSYEAHINPFKFCHGFVRAAQRLGAVILLHTPVTGFEIRHHRINAVTTHNGRFSAGVVITAVGAWTGEILSKLGIDFPMQFTHAEAVITERMPPILRHHISLSGFYDTVHGGERSVALGVSQHHNGTLLISNAIQKADTVEMDSTSWSMPALAKSFNAVFPRLVHHQIMRTWAGPSPFTPDRRPAVGWLSEIENLYISAGFHLSIPTIPILCEYVAAEIVQQQSQSSLDPFRPQRFEGYQ